MALSRFEQTITFFCSRELPACARFYGELLELPLVTQTSDALLYRVTANSLFGITAGPGREPEPGGAIFELTVASRNEVDMWYRKLSDEGVWSDALPRDVKPLGVYCFFAKDPNGYLIEIMHFPALAG